MERKSRMPQIQGVQRRMPYAAAKQQPPIASPWHALVYTRAGDRGILLFVRTAALLKGKQNGEFFITLYLTNRRVTINLIGP